MLLKKSVLAAGLVAALAVPASFRRIKCQFRPGHLVDSGLQDWSHANSGHHGSEDRERR